MTPSAIHPSKLSLQSKKAIAAVFILLICFLPISLFGNYSRILSNAVSGHDVSNTDFCRDAASPSTGAKIENNEFILEEYKTATQEIRARIDQEHLLFALKFVLSGAILSIVFKYYGGTVAKQDSIDAEELDENKSNNMRALCLCNWTAVLICSIVDVRLQFNTRIIADIGAWIRDCLEPTYSNPTVIGWEGYFFHVGLPKNSPFSDILNGDRPLLTGMLYLFSVFFFIYIPKATVGFDPRLSRDLLAISKLALPICVVLLDGHVYTTISTGQS